MIQRSIRRLSACASVLLLSACARPAGPAPSTSTPFSEFRKEWEAAFNRADTAALVSLYANDAVLIPPTGTVLTGGHVAAGETLGRLLEDRTLKLGLTHQRATANVGHVQGSWMAHRRGGGERQPILASGTYVMLFERGRDGRWAIAYHAWTQDRNPGETRNDMRPEQD